MELECSASYYSTSVSFRKLIFCLYQFLIAVNGLLYDTLAIASDAFPGLLIQISGIDRFPIFDHHMGLLDPWNVLLEHGMSIVHADRYDGAAGFLSDLKGTAVEGQYTEFLAVVACSFREDAYGYSAFHIVDCLEDAL